MLKTTLFILAFFEEKLLAMDYENFIQCLNMLPRTDFFNSEIVAKEYKKITKRFNVTPELLAQLAAEYREICAIGREGKCANARVQPVLPTHYVKSKSGRYQIIHFE